MTSEGEKILIVDDDVDCRRLLEALLMQQGYRVRGVETAGADGPSDGRGVIPIVLD